MVHSGERSERPPLAEAGIRMLQPAPLDVQAVLRAMPWKGLTRSPSTPPCASGAKDDASTGGEGGAGSGSDAVTRP